MAQEIVLPVKVQLENLQNIAKEMRSQLGTLKINSTGYQKVEAVISNIEKRIQQLQVISSRQFIDEKQFTAIDKEVLGIYDDFTKLRIAASKIKFSDLSLDASQKERLKEFDSQIKTIKDSLEQVKNVAKNTFLESDIGKAWAIDNPKEAGKSFEEITEIIKNEVDKQQKKLNEAIQAQKDYKERMASQRKLNAFIKGGHELTAETLGEEQYNKIFNTKGNFKNNGRSLLTDWLVQELKLDKSKAEELVKQSGNEVRAAFAQANGEVEKALKQEQARLGANLKTERATTNNGKTYSEAIANENVTLSQKKALQEEATQATLKQAKADEEGKASLEALTAAQANFKNECVANRAAQLQMGSALSAAEVQLKGLSAAVDAGRAKLAQLDQATSRLQGISNFVNRYVGAYAIIRKVTQAIRNAFSNIKELDKVITSIAVVTNMSQEDLWNKVNQYTQMAQQYGVMTKDVYSVSQIFYQQGLQTAQVMDLTTETLKMAKIAGIEYSAAANAMTVAVRAFKIEMEDAQQVTDTYSALAAKFAVSSAEIANAMEKTASSAASVGMTLESTSAFISVMEQTTRESAQNIGSALKSIISRYGEMKASPDKLIDVDGEEVAFNKVDTALSSIGISIKDAAGQFRNFDEVIMELAKKWGTLDNNTQRYIATVMAGNRQQSRFIALVSNYDELSRAMQVASNSENASIVQVAKTMDSLESKTNQLKNAFSQLYLDLHIENGLKSIYDWLTRIITTVGKLGTLKGAIPTLMNLFNFGLGAKGIISDIQGRINTTRITEQNTLNKKEEEIQKIQSKLELNTDDAKNQIEDFNKKAQEPVRKQVIIETTDQNNVPITPGVDTTTQIVTNNQVTAPTSSATNTVPPVTIDVQANTEPAKANIESFKEEVKANPVHIITTIEEQTVGANILSSDKLLQNGFAKNIQTHASGESFSNVANSDKDKVVNYMSKTIAGAVNAFDRAKELFAQAGTDSIETYLNSILAGEGRVTEVVEQVAHSAAAAIKVNEWLVNSFQNVDMSQINIEETIANLRSSLEPLKAEFSAINDDILSALIAQLMNSKEIIEQQGQQIGDALQQGIKASLEIASPSQAMIRLMLWVIKGIEKGLEQGHAAVANAANKLGQKIADGVKEGTDEGLSHASLGSKIKDWVTKDGGKNLRLIGNVARMAGTAVAAAGASIQDKSTNQIEGSKIVTGLGNGLSGMGTGISLGMMTGNPLIAAAGGIVGFLAGGIGAIIDGLHMSLEERLELEKKEAKEKADDALKAQAKVTDMGSSLDNIKQLQKAMYNSTEDMKAYKDAMNTLADQYPQLISAYDENGDIIIDLNAAERELAMARLQGAEAAEDAAMAEAQVNSTRHMGYQSGVTEINSILEGAKKQGLDLEDEVDILDLEVALNNYKSLYGEKNAWQLLYGSSTDKSGSRMTVKEAQKLQKILQGYLDNSSLAEKASQESSGHSITRHALYNSAQNSDLTPSQIESLESKGIYSQLFNQMIQKYVHGNNTSIYFNNKENTDAFQIDLQNQAELFVEWYNNKLSETSKEFLESVDFDSYLDIDSVLKEAGITFDTNNPFENFLYQGFKAQFEQSTSSGKKRLYETIYGINDISQLHYNQQLNHDLDGLASLNRDTAVSSLVSLFSENKLIEPFSDLLTDEIIKINDLASSNYSALATNRLLGLQKLFETVSLDTYQDNQLDLYKIVKSLDFTDYNTFLSVIEELETYGDNNKIDVQQITSVLWEIVTNLNFNVSTLAENIIQDLGEFSDNVDKIITSNKSGLTFSEAQQELQKIQANIKDGTRLQFDQIFTWDAVLSKYRYTYDGLNQALALNEANLQQKIDNLNKSREIYIKGIKPTISSDNKNNNLIEGLNTGINSSKINEPLYNKLADDFINNQISEDGTVDLSQITQDSYLAYLRVIGTKLKEIPDEIDVSSAKEAGIPKDIYDLLDSLYEGYEGSETFVEYIQAYGENILNDLKNYQGQKDIEYNNHNITQLYDLMASNFDNYLSYQTEYQELANNFISDGSDKYKQKTWKNFLAYIEEYVQLLETQSDEALNEWTEANKTNIVALFSTIDWSSLALNTDYTNRNQDLMQTLAGLVNKDVNDGWNAILDATLDSIYGDNKDAKNIARESIIASIDETRVKNYQNAISELLTYNTDEYLSETTKQLGKNFLNENQSIEQAAKESIKLAEKFLGELAKQIGKSGYTLEQYNQDASSILERTLSQKTIGKSLLDFAAEDGIDVSQLEGLANTLGMQLSDIVNVVTGEFENDIFAQHLSFDVNTGTYKITTSFEQFIDALNKKYNNVIDKTSQQYIDALKNSNKARIEKNRKVEKTVIEEVQGIGNAKPGDLVDLSQLSTLLANIVTKDIVQTVQETGGKFQGATHTARVISTALDDVNTNLKQYNAEIVDGVLQLSDNANLLGIAKELQTAAEKSGLDLKDGLAEIADTVQNILKSYAEAINTGITGGLSDVDARNLANKARDLGLKELDFTRTAEGLKLATNSAIELYTALKDVDALQAKLVFDELNKSLQETNEHYKGISEIANRIAWIEDKEHPERAKQYEKELALAKEIYAVRSTTEDDSFNFMSKDIPGGQKNPINYFNNWASAIKTFDEALKNKGSYTKNGQTYKSGFVDYEYWYNLVNELNNIARLGGDIEVAGVTLDGSLEKASELIQQGIKSLVVTDTGEVKVALNGMALNFTSGADVFSDKVTDGIRALAESQIKMLDGIIQFLQTAKQMQKLGDITNDNDTIDLSDLFPDITWDEGEKHSIKNEQALSWIKDTLLTAPEDSDLYKFISQAQLNNMSMLTVLKNAADENVGIDKETADALATFLNSMWQMSQSEYYDPNNIYDSFQKIANQSGLSMTIPMGDTTVRIEHGAIILEEQDSQGNTIFKTPDGTSYKDSKEALAASIMQANGIDVNAENYEFTGEKATGTIKIDGNEVNVEYDVEKGTLSFEHGNIKADSLDSYIDAVVNQETDEAAKHKKRIKLQLQAGTIDIDPVTYKSIDETIRQDLEAAFASGDVIEVTRIINENLEFKALRNKTPAEQAKMLGLELKTQIINISADISQAEGPLKKIQDALDNLKDKKITVTTIEKTIGQNTSNKKEKPNNGADHANAAGNMALAQGTLMGELGPELVVSNGHYFVVGQNGAEFVDLDPDAIVFNHLQTRSLLEKGMSSGRGQALVSEKRSVAYAKGSMHGGPARASIDQELQAAIQLREEWRALASLSVKDFATKGGGGGGGGDPKAFIKDLERWYNWLQRISTLEKEISLEESKRAEYQSAMTAKGKEYYASQIDSLKKLQEQAAVQMSLNKAQEAYAEKRKNELNTTGSYRALYEFDKEGQLKYKTGKYEWLATLAGTDPTTNKPNYTAKEQYDAIVAAGFKDTMLYDASGNKIKEDDYAALVQAFWDGMEKERQEMQNLYDNVQDGKKKVVDLQKQQNDIMRDIEDNQIAVENKVLTALESARQRAIDDAKKEKDAIQESTSQVVDGLNRQLEQERRNRDSQKSSEELSKLQRRLGILQRTGGSAAEIANLQQEISDKQYDKYFETQENQIQAMKDASDLQIQRLDTQIKIMEETLAYEKEHGLLWNEVYDVLEKSADEVANYIKDNDVSYFGKSDNELYKNLREDVFSIQRFQEFMKTGGSVENLAQTYNGDTQKAESEKITKESEEYMKTSDEMASAPLSTTPTAQNKQPEKEKQWHVADQASVGFWTEAEAKAHKEQLIAEAQNELNSIHDINSKEFKTAQQKLTKWKTAQIKWYDRGGMVDETGPAILHAKEAVLTARQTNFLRNDLLGNQPNSLLSFWTDMEDMKREMQSLYGSTANTPVIIENATVEMNVSEIASDYDARRAGEQALDKILAIARKTSASNRVSR